MTACRNKAKGAVAAALAGALTLGAAPVMALADGAQMMAASEADAFNAGTVASYMIGNAKVKGNEAATIKKSDLADSKIVITSVTLDGVDAETQDVTMNTMYFKETTKDQAGTAGRQIDGKWYTYVCQSSAFDANLSSFTPGNYIAVVYQGNINTSTQNYDAPSVAFTVVADSLEGVTLEQPIYAVDGSLTGEYTDSFTYDDRQSWNDTKLFLNDTPLTSANFEVYAAEDDGTDLSGQTSPIQAGDYKVVVTGTGAYGGQEVTLDVTVAKFDLSKADLYVEDVVMPATAPSLAAGSVKGADVAAIASGLSDTYMDFQIQGNTWGSDKAGEYTYTLSVKPNTTAANNVTGTATLKFNRVNAGAKAVDWAYDGHGGWGYTGLINVDRSVEEDTFGTPWELKSLDLTKFSGSFVDANGKKNNLTSDQIVVTIKDSDGNVVSDMTKKGVYTVTLEAKSSAYDFNIQRSTATITVNVKQGTVENAGTTFTFDGKVVTSISNQTYSGQDVLDRLGIQVKDSNGNLLEEGSDYVVTVKKDGKDVESAVDAGTYTVTVTSDLYKFANGSDKETINFTIDPFALSSTNTRVTFPTMISYKKNTSTTVEFVPYTGSDITPIVEVALTKDADGNPVWTELNADYYDFGFEYSKTYSGTLKDADSVKELGYYVVSAYVDGKATDNFTGSYTSGKFNVSDQKVFVDVPSTEYYAPYVYAAVNQGYVEGMGGSNLFAPNASISRADMVCVLYRMAGGTVQSEDWSASAEETEYLAKFSDVSGNEYFAQALAWASRTGVVSGYEDGRFGAADQITVEQFVTMLGRYAELVGNFEAVEDVDATLAEKADGSQVSDFAAEYVAWALENGFIGRDDADIQPQSDISRGRSITIAVRYQPEKIAASDANSPLK